MFRKKHFCELCEKDARFPRVEFVDFLKIGPRTWTRTPNTNMNTNRTLPWSRTQAKPNRTHFRTDLAVFWTPNSVRCQSCFFEKYIGSSGNKFFLYALEQDWSRTAFTEHRTGVHRTAEPRTTNWTRTRTRAVNTNMNTNLNTEHEHEHKPKLQENPVCFKKITFFYGNHLISTKKINFCE